MTMQPLSEAEIAAATEAAEKAFRARALASKFRPQVAAILKFTDKTKSVPVIKEADIDALQQHIFGLEDAMQSCSVEDAFRDLMSCATLGRDLMKLDRTASTLVRDSGTAGDLSSMRKMGQAQTFQRAVEKLEDALVEEVMTMTKQCLCAGNDLARERGPEG